MDNEEIFNQNLNKPVFKKIHLQLASFLGGPLAIVYILAENYKVFGNDKEYKKTWIFGILLCMVFFVIVYYLSKIRNSPNLIVPLIYILIGTAIMQSWQGENIDGHINQGGQVYPLWRAIVIGLVSLVVTIMAAVLFAVIIQIFLGTPAISK